VSVGTTVSGKIVVRRKQESNALRLRNPRKGPGMARVLLADDNPASRLTLQTVLEAGGYRVDSAASAAEAVGLLDQAEYELVLTDIAMEEPESGLKVLEHARMKAYRPATAVVTSWQDSGQARNGEFIPGELLIEPEDIPELLGKVARLIGERASRRVARMVRHA
jgi:CheY-like chemotaxis protein